MPVTYRVKDKIAFGGFPQHRRERGPCRSDITGGEAGICRGERVRELLALDRGFGATKQQRKREIVVIERIGFVIPFRKKRTGKAPVTRVVEQKPVVAIVDIAIDQI